MVFFYIEDKGQDKDKEIDRNKNKNKQKNILKPTQFPLGAPTLLLFIFSINIHKK